MKDRELEVTIASENHILKARTKMRSFICEYLNFSLLERMHALTAVSELTRNILKYAIEGKILASIAYSAKGKRGVNIVFKDNGPGIPDIKKAMTPKPIHEYQAGMGLGLSGSKQLADEFEIDSKAGKGTTVTWIKWER